MFYKKQINIGLVGYGYWGPNYARILAGLQNIRLKWICDLDNKLLIKAKKDNPHICTTADFAEIIDDNEINAVIIATPATTHAKLVKSALNYGKHVLVEKPITTNSRECRELYKLSKAKKLQLLAGQTYLYHPAVIYIKNLLDRRSFGKLLFISCQRTNLGPIRKDVSAAWDLASHDISTVLYLTGKRIIDVSAVGKAFIKSPFFDTVNINLKLDGGSLVNILVSWLSPVKTRTMTIVGNRKMIAFDDLQSVTPIKVYNKKIITLKPGERVKFRDFQNYSVPTEPPMVPHIHQFEPLKAEVINFIDAIRGYGNLKVIEEHEVEVINILEKVDQSLLLSS